MPPTRVSGTRLDAIVGQAREPMFLLGADRRFLLVNRAWEELTGHKAATVIGRECHPHGPTRAGDLDGLCGSFYPPSEAMGGQPAGSNTLIIHAGGDRHRKRVEFWPFHDDEGTLLALLGMVRAADATPQVPDSESQGLRSELLEIRGQVHARHGFDSMIGRGAEHRRLLDQITIASNATAPVLIVGESGTGKLLAARTIHFQGARRQAPILAFDCKALPPETLEYQLFGPPVGDHGKSPLRLPDGASLLIGDILDLPRDLQSRLATSLDGRVRLVATTTGDPEAALRSERLRPDLYFALTTLVLRLRPLRERRGEIPLFAQHFLERFNLRGERRREGFHPSALAALSAYDWPGNLRELAKVVEVAHGRGSLPSIQLDDIPPAIRGHLGGAYLPPHQAVGPLPLKDMLTLVERRLIERALDRAGHNKSKAAKILGVNRPFLYRRIKELDIADETDPTSVEDPPESA